MPKLNYRVGRRGTIMPYKNPVGPMSQKGSKALRAVNAALALGKIASSSNPVSALAREGAMYVGSRIANKIFNKQRKPAATGRALTKGYKYRTTGKYVGMLRKKKIRKSKKTLYLNRGFENTTEVTGVVSDPDCVYIGHSTTCGQKILNVIMQSLLRKLFKLAGQDLVTAHEKIRGYNWTVPGFSESDGWQLQLLLQNVGTGAYEIVSYNTFTSDNISRILGDANNGVAPQWPDFVDKMMLYASGLFGGSFDERAMLKPVKLSLSQRDGNGTNNFYHMRSEIDLEKEIIHLKVVSELKVQNRTLSATGGSNTDDVSNNPLTGKIYQFNHSVPRMKSSDFPNGTYPLTRLQERTGALTVTASQLSVASDAAVFGTSTMFHEPPNYQIFGNVKKHGRVLLQPAEIKKDVLVYSFSAQFHKFFEQLSWKPSIASSASNAFSLSHRSKGKFTLLALEDIINVNGTQKISIAYEINRTEACYLSTMRGSGSVGTYSSHVQNSIS